MKTINELSDEIENVRALIKEMGEAHRELLEIQERAIKIVPRLLGVSDLDSAIAVIKKARNEEVHGLRRATLSASNVPPPRSLVLASESKTWGPGRSIPDDVKNEIMKELQNRVDPWTIKRKYNVSISSIQKIKDAAGLVRHRNN